MNHKTTQRSQNDQRSETLGIKMIQWIKNLFKKEEQRTPYDLERWRIRNENWHKMNREKELYDIFRRAQMDTRLFPGQTHIPYQFVFYIEKCIEYGMIQMALDGLEHLKWLTVGTNINLDELTKRVYNTKEYKEYLVKKMLNDIEKDFE